MPALAPGAAIGSGVVSAIQPARFDRPGRREAASQTLRSPILIKINIELFWGRTNPRDSGYFKIAQAKLTDRFGRVRCPGCTHLRCTSKPGFDPSLESHSSSCPQRCAGRQDDAQCMLGRSRSAPSEGRLVDARAHALQAQANPFRTTIDRLPLQRRAR
jgi:hypothetical protein